MSYEGFVHFTATKDEEWWEKLAYWLVPRTCNPSIDDELKVKTKDPLWILGRQQQLGEFRARNGGVPVQINVEAQTRTIDEVRSGGEEHFKRITDPDLPLEFQIEAMADVSAQEPSFIGCWNSQRLEYEFDVRAGDAILKAKEYDGSDLDWFDFDSQSDLMVSAPPESFSFLPSKANYRGMPSSRWWRFDDGKVDIGAIRRPNLNFLAMVMMEFMQTCSNEWFILPLPQVVGTLRSIKRVSVTDSFGKVTEIKPTNDTSIGQTGFKLFTLTNSDRDTVSEDAHLFFLPNTVAHSQHSKPLELVTLARDEMANLAWAIEHIYQNGEESINRDDVEAQHATPEPTPDGLPLYRIRSHIARNWIPYIAQLNAAGQLMLRRGRTDEKANKDTPQYKGKFIEESRMIYEEEVPAIPLQLTRRHKLVAVGPEKWALQRNNGQWCLVRENNRKVRSWIGKTKEPAADQPSCNLKFDYLIEP